MYAWSTERSTSITDRRREFSSVHRNAIDSSISSTSAQRALDLLNIMEELSEAGNTNVAPDIYSYTTCIQAFARAKQAEKAEQVMSKMLSRGLRPTRRTYTALMSALSKAGHPDRAYDILQNMMDAYEEGGFNDLKPDSVAFSTVIDGWAQVASLDRPEAAIRALEILDDMKARANEGMGPTAQTYTSVLTALGRTETQENCDIARLLLQEMEDEYDRICQENKGADQIDDAFGGKWSIRPTVIQYNCVLSAYSKCKMINKAIKTQKLLRHMQYHPRQDCHPDIISYNCVLQACASSFGNPSMKEASFRIAAETFKAVLSNNNNDNDGETHLEATSTTFAHFAKCCRRLIPHAKQNSLLNKTLQICMKKGMLNHIIVQQVQSACKSTVDWDEAAGELANYVDWKADFRKCKQVPNEWTCNARR